LNGHHLILGETVDYITGQVIQNTHDEQYRQKIARLLVEDCGYAKSDVLPRIPVAIRAGDKNARIILDFALRLSGKYHMIIQYGPGSLTTRHRPGLALSRILEKYQVPVVVVTNGEDADILDGRSGEVCATGLKAIPSKSRLTDMAENAGFSPVSEKQQEMEARIVYAFEIDGRCPCDDTHSDCRLPESPGDGSSHGSSHGTSHGTSS
jgi:hypothetical protein